ncbi:MAG: GH3 auxin-responsive promoter family protein [bacterium]|nr:GH3 auxin-responsive promoter family protein [bacterium]
MSLVNNVKVSILRRVYDRRMRELDQVLRDPWRFQEQAFRRILSAASVTAFGRDRGLTAGMTLAEFRRRVPPAPYEAFDPYIGRMLAGERSVLWPGLVREFSLTSGTTAARGNKYIPFTQGLWLSNQTAARDSLFFHVRRRGGDFGVFMGKMLFLGGTTTLNRERPGVYSGDLSALTIRRLPLLYRRYYLPGYRVGAIPDWEEKIDRIARMVRGVNLTFISGIPSWVLVLLDKIRADHGRPEATLKEIFPDFRFLVSGGVNVHPYLDLFRRTVGPEVDFAETYPASEAFLAVQDGAMGDGMLLETDSGVFYEFVPAGRIDDDDPPRLALPEVQVGVNYAILLTTPGGLYSYILGDTVRFVSTDPPRLVVTGRTKHFLSAFGEHLIVEEAEEAVRTACERTGAQVRDFTAAPVFPGKSGELPRHEWLIEFETPPADLPAFERILDERLGELNADYAVHRRDDASLLPPRVTVLRPGSFYAFMKARGKLGGQNKVPRLKNDRELADMLHGLQ